MSRFYVDPRRRFLTGITELTIQPLHRELSRIRINCRQCDITGAYVNDIPTNYSYVDPTAKLTLGDDTTIAHHHVYKSKYLTALREGDEGELSISIPKICIKQMSESEAQLVTNDIYLHSTTTVLQDDPSLTEKTVAPSAPAPSFAPLTIRIEYTLDDPDAGLVFVNPDKYAAPYRYHHVYTVNQPVPGATRSWLPCLDRIHDRCTWDMMFLVPAKLGPLPGNGEDDTNEDDLIEDEDPPQTVVVCSGQLVEQTVYPLNTSRTVVHYSLSSPTAAPFIGFAIGPFQMIKLTPEQQQEKLSTRADLDENQQQKLMAEINMMSNIYAFTLPGFEEYLSASCDFLIDTMHFYAQEYGSYPFTDYKLVFVEEAWTDTMSSASLTICNSRLLHPENVIDQTYSSRRILSIALARQWFGIHIVQKTWADAWLIYGMANLMGALFIKQHLGNSEFRLRLKKDMELCCALDINRPPLYNQALQSPVDPDDLKFIELKAPLVLYMLDRRMCKMGHTVGFSRAIPKILLSAISGELVQNALSTHHFLKICRKVSGFDTKTFADQWVYRSGCPKFKFSFHFNRKKMVVEFHMRQENTNSCLGRKNGDDTADINNDTGISSYQDLVAPLFTGNLTVRIHEADGTPYEHILDIQSANHKFEVQFNTKYKRIRRNTKRFAAKQAAAAAAVAEEELEKEDGEGGTTNVLGIIPALGLGMPIFEDPRQRDKWKVVEWGQDEQDRSGAASAMFDWIRLDADFEWLCTIDFQQPDYMWAGQLTKDRDVVAQHEAIEALKHMPSLPTATSLLRALLDPKCFYKIRMESAYALAKCGGSDMNWVGLHQLFKMYLTRFCVPNPHADEYFQHDIPLGPVIPKQNNFSNLCDYFVQKGAVIAFSQVRDERGMTPIKVRQLLLDLLKYNDNVGNHYSDSDYIATLITALADSFIPSRELPDEYKDEGEEGRKLLEAAVAQIDRFRTLDFVIPSYHNAITVSCIEALTKLALNGLVEPDYELLLTYTRYGNFIDVRLCAFDSLLLLCGLQNAGLTAYFLGIVQNDPCAPVSQYVARSMLAWLGLAMRDAPESIQHRYFEEFSEEEGRAVLLDESRSQRDTEPDDRVYIENLRKRFEGNLELQQSIWNVLNTPSTRPLPHCVRKHLLQLCEYLFQPIDAGLKVTIRMPPSIPEIAEDLSQPSTPVLPYVAPMSPTLRNANQGAVTSPVETATKRDSKEEAIIEKKNRERAIAETAQQDVRHQPSPQMFNTPTPAENDTNDATEKPSAFAVPKISSKKPDNMSLYEFKKCRRVLTKIQRHRSALVFLQPVDEELDGAPGYYTLITRPMDLGTIRTNLENGVYMTLKQMEADLRLMLTNCFSFNAPGTYVYDEGKTLESVLDKELATIKAKEEEITAQARISAVQSNGVSEIPPQNINNSNNNNVPPAPIQPIPEPTESPMPVSVAPQVPPKPVSTKQEKPLSEMEKCAIVLARTMESQHAFEFLRPVDPIRQGIPHYTNIIKKPMDLGTIKSKLKTGKYSDRWQLDDDVRLMLRNCFTFNPPKTYVYEEGKRLEEIYNQEWRRQFGDTMRPPPTPPAAPVKRKAASIDSQEDNAPAQPVAPKPKKAKVSATETPVKKSKSLHQRFAVQPQMNNDNMERCGQILKLLQAQPSAEPFQKPVEAEEVPGYYDYIERPMDLSSVRQNLECEEYSTIWEFERDVRQIFWNCYGFNDPSSWTANQGKELERYFNKLWCDEFGDPNRLQGDDLQLAEKVLTKLREHDAAIFFNEPVNEKYFENYSKVISTPMDLRTISEKLLGGKYTSLQQVDADIRLVFSNCFKYNKSGSLGYEDGKKLEKYYNSNIGKELRNRVKQATGEKSGAASPARSSSSKSITTVATPSASTSATAASTKAQPSTSSQAPSTSNTTNTLSPSKTSNKMPSALVNRLETLLNKLMNHAAAYAFLEPVDPIALNIPHYPQIIKKPMDLGTVKQKLKNQEYSSLNDFENDLRLIFTNCYTFNGIDHPVSESARALEKIVNREIPAIRKKEEGLNKPTPAKTPAKSAKTTKSGGGTKAPLKGDLRKYKMVLDKLQTHASFFPFSVPVDPVLLQIPTYFDVIKKPMDFGTIRKKLDHGKYSEPGELLEDARQVFINCFTFNLPDDPVSHMGREIEAEFNKLCASKGVQGIGVTKVETQPLVNEQAQVEEQVPLEEQASAPPATDDMFGLPLDTNLYDYMAPPPVLAGQKHTLDDFDDAIQENTKKQRALY